MRKLATFLAFGLLLTPSFSFAEGGVRLCSKTGYTIATLNGVFTDDKGARNNLIALSKIFGPVWNNQKIDYQYLLNATHLAGFGDGLKAFKQKVEEGVPSDDYDLIEMVKEASEKVTTQKLLLVGHSQGNFYANSFYDYVTKEDTPSSRGLDTSPLKRGRGGVPRESIGVYSVATPSDHVAGDGKYLTSKTDKVIAGLVGSLPFFRIMPPNTDIEIKEGDSSLGHGFSDIYLKYKPAEIIEGILWSLDKLTTNNTQLTTCIEPPKLTIAHKAVGAMFAVADPVANAGKETLVYSVGVAYQGSVFVVKVGVQTAGAVAALGNFVAETTVATTVWTYKTGVAAAKATGSAIADVTGAAYSAVKSLVNGTGGDNLGLSNTASVALGVPLPKLPAVDSTGQVDESGQKAGRNNIGTGAPEVSGGVSESEALESLAKTLALAEAQVAEIRRAIDNNTNYEKDTKLRNTPDTSAESGKSESDDTPKIIFIGPAPGSGGAGFGGGEKPKVLVSSGDSSILTLVVQSSSLSAPTLTVSQCDYSLALDGCLLATTTVHFAWTSITGADYYEINKNGTVATTTDTTVDVAASDFSDYVLSVSAISTATTSPTSSKTVSVATIPVAINEIAWMGTLASTNDEWLELKNNTAHTINLSQWEIQAADGTPHIQLSGTIQPRQYLVFERTNNNTITDVLAYQIYTGALGNTGEELILSYASTPFDRTPAIVGGEWLAGSNGDKDTMERFSSTEAGDNSDNWDTWGSYFDTIKNGLDADGNEINGTPGARNGLNYLLNKGEDILEDLTLTTEEGLYIIIDSISVSASSTLSVEPGVVIKFDSDAELEILGQIRAEGTADSQIVFQSLDDDEQDGEILFEGGVGTSTLQYVRVENTRGITLDAGARLEISDSQFVDNEKGLDLNDGSSVIVDNTSFASTTEAVIAADDGGSVTLRSVTITDTFDDDAVEVDGGVALSISSSTVNRVYDGDGIKAFDSSVVITNSTVDNIFSGDGIIAFDSTITIASSTVNNVNDGDGINVFDSTMTVTDSIVSNIYDGDGIIAFDSNVSISSSTVEDVYDGGAVSLYDSNSTITNTTVQNGTGGDGVVVSGGTATIIGSEISGFIDGTGINVDSPTTPVVISNTEVSGNDVGISADAAASVSIAPSVSVHDNDVNVDAP